MKMLKNKTKQTKKKTTKNKIELLICLQMAKSKPRSNIRKQGGFPLQGQEHRFILFNHSALPLSPVLIPNPKQVHGHHHCVPDCRKGWERREKGN